MSDDENQPNPAGQNPQQGPADPDAAAAAAVNVTPANDVAKVPLPSFTGEGKSDADVAASAKFFIRRWTAYAESNRFSDTAKVATFGSCLKSIAATWLQMSTDYKRFDTSNWPTLIARFNTRFVKDPNHNDISKELAKLKMGDTERVQDFLDRCMLATAYLSKTFEPDAAATQAVQDQFMKAQDAIALCNFLTNLRPEIQTRIDDPNLQTLDEFAKKARTIEVNLKNNNNKISAISIAEEDIAAFNSFRNNNNRRFGQNQNQPQQRGKPPPPTYVCRLCGIKGHWIQNCSKSNKQQMLRTRNAQAQPQSNRQSNYQPPPRHTGAVPKTNSWQQPRRQQQQQQQQIAPLQQQEELPMESIQQQPLYPVLPHTDDYTEQQQQAAASYQAGWPLPSNYPFQQ